VSVIDATTDEVLGTAAVAQAMGEGIAADTRTGRVYTEEHYAQPRTLKVFER
jgi:DNA-binding beta-propeller fold protein YncE